MCASVITTPGRCSNTLRRASAAFPASATTSMSSSSSSRRRNPWRSKTWSCTSRQRISLLPNISSDCICAGGHTGQLLNSGQRNLRCGAVRLKPRQKGLGLIVTAARAVCLVKIPPFNTFLNHPPADYRSSNLIPAGIRYNRAFMLRYFTAGESNGEALVAFLSGMPAGLKIDQTFLDRELWRRQQGYGRGGRMKIERDSAHILSGVRQGLTIGSPISVQLENRDWKNWQESLPVGEGDIAKHKRVASPRPGHADLAGALKYNFPEARYVLERASARESAARVAIGAIAKLFLRELGIDVLSHVVTVGSVTLPEQVEWNNIRALYS